MLLEVIYVHTLLSRIGYQQAPNAIERRRVGAHNLRLVLSRATTHVNNFEKNPRGFVNSCTDGMVRRYWTAPRAGVTASIELGEQHSVRMTKQQK